MTETRATYTVLQDATCDVAEAAGHPVDCEHCPGCGAVDVIGDELRELTDDELCAAIGLD
jgi:hypothetical protein